MAASASSAMFSYTPSPSAADASTPYVVDDHIWPGDPASLGFYGKFFLFLTTTVAFSFVSSFTSSFYDMRIHSIGCSYVARTLIQALCNVCFMPISLDAQIKFPSFRFCLCSCGFQLLPHTLLLCSFLFYNRLFTSRLVLYFHLSLISISI